MWGSCGRGRPVSRDSRRWGRQRQALPVKQPDYSDLAPVHWRLRHYFEEYDVLHVTDAWFSYARTALRHHRRHGTPLVLSTHTDVPGYTRVVTRKVIERLVRPGVIRDRLLGSWHVHRLAEKIMRRRFRRYLARCDHVLASSDVYASADLFVFPSTTEVMPNVVIEAKACGLPVVVSRHGGSSQLVEAEGRDGVLMDSLRPADWAAAIEPLWSDAPRRHSMGAAARRHIETGWPTWEDVLREDLLPVWRRVGRQATEAETELVAKVS